MNKNIIIIIAVIISLIILVLLVRNIFYKEKFVKSPKSFLEMIPIVLYINLENRPDRNVQFRDNFKKDNDKNKLIRIDAVSTPENGAIGCLKSHIKALEFALEKFPNSEHVLICEDDFYIKDMDYCEKMLFHFFNNIKNWDVLMLGHNTISSDKTAFENIIKINDSQTASAYLIKTKYIPKLLSIYKRDLEEYERTKVWGYYYNDQTWKPLQKVDNWYAIEPRVGIQRASFSNIQNGNVNYEVFSY